MPLEGTYTPSCRRVAPYRSLAAEYDTALGRDFFRRVRSAFERLQGEYGFTFRNAADIGCGTGLFARYLARHWRVPVFAVDRSPEMLAEARRTCCGERVQILCQDVRELCLPFRVDLITANYDVVNHLVDASDVRQMLCRVRDNLAPGGHFYFDFITSCLGLPPGRRTAWTRQTPRGFVRQFLYWDPYRHLLRIDVVSRRFDLTRTHVEQHTERTYSPVQFARWLLDAGFILRGAHDEATLQPAGGCSARMIVIAQNPAPQQRR